MINQYLTVRVTQLKSSLLTGIYLDYSGVRQKKKFIIRIIAYTYTLKRSNLSIKVKIHQQMRLHYLLTFITIVQTKGKNNHKMHCNHMYCK